MSTLDKLDDDIRSCMQLYAELLKRYVLSGIVERLVAFIEPIFSIFNHSRYSCANLSSVHLIQAHRLNGSLSC